MPILSNPKHEAFARHMADRNITSNAEAARLAGYSERRARVMASELCKRPEINCRVDELRNRVTVQTVTHLAITKEIISREMWETYRAARDLKQLSTARQALVDLGGELFGMFVKKTETKIDLPTDPAQLTDSQLLQLQHWMERMRYGDDQQAIQEARKRAGLLEIEGPVTDVVPEKKNEDGW